MSETRDDLREALARELHQEIGVGFFWERRMHWRLVADVLIRGPLAPILAQVSALQAEVERLQRVEGERGRLERVPCGSGSRPSDQAPAGLAPSGFDPSRMALVPRDDDSRPLNDSALPSAMIWAGGDAYDDLTGPGCASRMLDLDSCALAVGIYRAMIAEARPRHVIEAAKPMRPVGAQPKARAR